MTGSTESRSPYFRDSGSGSRNFVAVETWFFTGASRGFGRLWAEAALSRGASKWAVEAFHESLAQEVKGFGIKVTLIEPGAYATEFAREAWEAESKAAPRGVKTPKMRGKAHSYM